MKELGIEISWQVALGLLIIINTLSVLLTKIAADKLPKKAVGIFYQYLFCLGLAILYALSSGKADVNSALILVAAVGFINATGNYFQWRAFELSLSKTVLFFPLMEIMAIGLAVIFLGEIKLWNAQLTLGAVLCFLAMWLFRLNGGEKGILNKKWLFYTAGMIAIFGLAGFLTKLFSFTVSREIFLLGWYAGAFIGSLPMLAMERVNPVKITKDQISAVFLLSLTIIGALFSLYWVYQLGGPVSLVLPLRGLFITLVPACIGLFIFKERAAFSKREWLGFVAGIIGVALVLLR